MAVIQFQCPNCNRSLEAGPELQNQLLDCPSCEQEVEVPGIRLAKPEEAVVLTAAATEPQEPSQSEEPPSLAQKASTSIYNALFGTASEIDPAQVAEEFRPLLVENEEIVAAYKIVRNAFVFTQHRLILADKQGLTGTKTEYRSIPYKSISQFSVETAGLFDADAELRIYIAGNPAPIKTEFSASEDVLAVQKIIATQVLAEWRPKAKS